MSERPQKDNADKEAASGAQVASVLSMHPSRGPRAWMRKHWIITSLIGIYLFFKLLGVAWSWVLTPTINPHPQDPVTIRGTFPFDKGFDLQFNQQARSTTPWVNRECGRFVRSAGIPCLAGWQDIPHKKVDATHYEVTFYRDYYLPGIAGWKHEGLGYTAQDANGPKRGGNKGFPNRVTAVKCSVGSPAFNRSLACLELDQAGPDIYDKATRYAEVNFYLVSEPTPVTKGN